MLKYFQVWSPLLGAIDPNQIEARDDERDPPLIAWIPADERNADWQDYQAWLAEGNEPGPPQRPDAPPA